MIVDTKTAVRLLKAAVPDWEWLLRRLESEDGRLRFPAQVYRAINNLKIESYPLLYENELAIGLVAFRAFMSQDELVSLSRQLEQQSPEERGQELQSIVDGLIEVDEVFTLPKTPAEEQRVLEAFKCLSSDEQADAIKRAQYLWMGFLAGFYQSLSVMVHGEKLTALVSQAKAGNDEALCKAVQIDKRILTTIPYFKQRYEQATFDQNQAFVDALTYRLSCAPYKGKIRHKSLWMTFSFLDQLGLLDILRHSEILDICDETGVGGFANRIEDVKNLSKRLNEYRHFQGRVLTLSTP